LNLTATKNSGQKTRRRSPKLSPLERLLMRTYPILPRNPVAQGKEEEEDDEEKPQKKAPAKVKENDADSEAKPK
jgi:hypothetical protein